MLDAFGRLFVRLDLEMMLAAVTVGMAAALCLFRLRSRMRHSRGMVRIAWIFLSGTVAGVGGWGAELTALAAYRPDLPTGFDPVGLLGALVAAVGGSTAALALAWTGRDRLRMATGGLVLAFAAAAMHVIAVYAWRMPARISWEPILVWLAVVVAAAGYVSALLAAGSARSFLRQVVGAAGFGAATLALFLISLAGMTITADPTVQLPDGLIGGRVSTFIALTLAILTTLGALGAAYIDDISSRSALGRIRRLADAAREGIVVLSDRTGAIQDCNAAFSAMAAAPVEALIGRRLVELLSLEGDGVLEHGHTQEGALRSTDNIAVPVQVHARPLQEPGDDGDTATVISLRDLREQRAVEDHIRFLAEHDPLTGLPNRALMNAALEEKIAGGAILCIVRVVNHAEINSLYGHAAGDAVLVKTAERLKRFAAQPLPGYTCMTSRLGGSEMAFLVFGQADLNAAPGFTSAVTKSLRRPIIIDSQPIEPQVCIGVSSAPLDAETGPDMVRHAEVALESAARDGSLDGVVYFRQDLQDEVIAQRTLLHDLKVGLAEDQLVVHYQPQARTSDASLCGFEALVRWVHPVRGFMPPDSFIPAAEQSGLIIELGEQVLRRACHEATAWPHPVPVAVNLSPLQVGQVDLPRLVHQVLMETGLPPSRLELEITESALFRDYQRALDTLRRLKALGVKIAMDDFGTGFSSLSTLQSFPFDKIKIDKSFVNGVGTLERSTVIVKAVLGIGKGLDIPVVAEGVETAEQMAFLRDEGCAVVQGYHIGKPGRIEMHQALFDAIDGRGDGSPRAARRPEPAGGKAGDSRAIRRFPQTGRPATVSLGARVAGRRRPSSSSAASSRGDVMKRETRKPLTLAMTPDGERGRTLRTPPPAPDFTPPPPAAVVAPTPIPRLPRAPPTPRAAPAPVAEAEPPVPRAPKAAREAGPWLARNAYPLAGAAALLWGGTLVAFVAGYEGKGWAFDYRPFRWALTAGLALMPMGFMALFAYAVRQGARLAAEAGAARTLAAELSVPAALAAGRTGAAMEAVRAEIARAAETAEQAGARLTDLRAQLCEQTDAVSQAAAAAERGARTLGGRLQAERAELSALNAALGDQAVSITDGLAQQARRMTESSQEAQARLAEAELGLATRTAELFNAAAEAARAAEGAGDELSTQNGRLQALAAELREEREDFARTADALLVEEEALATRLESRRARLLEAADASRTDAAALIAAAAEGGDGLRSLVAGAAARLREMTEAAIREEDALDARARERTSHYLALVAEERAALEGDARQALTRLASASEAARQAAAAAAAETGASLEQAGRATEETVRRRVDDLAEAAFAAGQRADQAFDARIAAARRTIDASAGLVEEAGARAAARIEAGMAGARSAMDEIGRLLAELEARLDQAPQVAGARAGALRDAVEAGAAELAAAARLAAEETQAIDAAFQARAKANYAALGEAARRMGAMALPAPAAAAQPPLGAAAPRPSIAAPPPPGFPLAAAFTSISVGPPAQSAAAPVPAPVNGAAAEAPAFRPEAAPTASPGLRPRLKLTPTPDDAALTALFEAPAPDRPADRPATPSPPREESWSWKDLLSTLDDGAAMDDEAVSDRLIGEIEALGVDSRALLPRARTDEIAQALARGEGAGAREAVRRLAPAALRRLARRVQTDRVLRDQAERHRLRFGARVAQAAQGDAPEAAALLASDPGRAWLLLDAAAGEPH